MKGILKIYHPEETLKYTIKSSYCKAFYSNKQHFLEVEIITNDSLDHVDDDSLQYNFPQLAFNLVEYPIENDEIVGQSFLIAENEDESYTEVDLYDDEEAYLSDNALQFSKDDDGELQLLWQGKIDDFFTGAEEVIPFKLKCHFRQDDLSIDED